MEMLWKEGKWESGKNSPKCNIFSIMGIAVGLSPRAIHFLETFHGNISIADCAYLQPFISYKLLKLTVLKKTCYVTYLALRAMPRCGLPSTDPYTTFLDFHEQHFHHRCCTPALIWNRLKVIKLLSFDYTLSKKSCTFFCFCNN